MSLNNASTAAFQTTVIKSDAASSPYQNALTTCLTYFILLNTLIPISLIVTIEIVKYVQQFFINFDQLNTFNGVSCEAFRSTINEELGMVEYLFTDKTGTLTKNKMKLTKVIVGNKKYNRTFKSSHKKPQGQKQVLPQLNLDDKNHSQITKSQQAPSTQSVSDHFYSPELQKCVLTYNDVIWGPFGLLESQDTLSQLNHEQECSLMVLSMALNHECIISKQGYRGPSPDEITLVESAATCGLRFRGNQLKTIQIEIGKTVRSQQQDNTNLQINSEILLPNNLSRALFSETLLQEAQPLSSYDSHIVQFSQLQLFSFDSDRKRASVIVAPFGKDSSRYILLSKGADSIMFSRLANSQKTKANDLLFHLSDMSRTGLRTLVFGYKIIRKKDYDNFKIKMDELAPTDSEGQAALVNQLETDLILLGATGVEDELQDNVADVLADIMRAGIKPIMLTGDKLETAENIAKSCRLISQSMQILRVTDQNAEESLEAAYLTAQQGRKFSLIIEGGALSKVLESTLLHNLFEKCDSAVCCRITPQNKADVVLMAKDTLKKLTLSVGDGANDVPMIMAANVGVGVYGNEGMNAVSASDFAIGQFQCLWRLMFVHGRWNYIRIVELIKYFFYKNVTFTLGQFWFSFFCLFSGSTIYNATYITLFNTIFTCGPPVVRALLQQDINYVRLREEDEKIKTSVRKSILVTKLLESQIVIDMEARKLFPNLYEQSQKQMSFSQSRFLLMVLQAAIESAFIFLLTIVMFWDQPLCLTSVALFSGMVVVATTRICVEITHWTICLVFTILLTSLGPYVGFVALMAIFEFEMKGTFVQLFALPKFWAVIALIIGASVLSQQAFVMINKMFFPSPLDLARSELKSIREQQNNNQLQEIQSNSVQSNNQQ